MVQLRPGHFAEAVVGIFHGRLVADGAGAYRSVHLYARWARLRHALARAVGDVALACGMLAPQSFIALDGGNAVAGLADLRRE